MGGYENMELVEKFKYRRQSRVDTKVLAGLAAFGGYQSIEKLKVCAVKAGYYWKGLEKLQVWSQKF